MINVRARMPRKTYALPRDGYKYAAFKSQPQSELLTTDALLIEAE